MCVILACDDKTGKPTKQMLIEAENMNDDGGSIAWIKGNKICLKETLLTNNLKAKNN